MRHIHVTRADGRPAYEGARPRLRQSHFDALRKMPGRYAELRAEAEMLDYERDGKIGRAEAALYTAAGLAYFAFLYLILP